MALVDSLGSPRTRIGEFGSIYVVPFHRVRQWKKVKTIGRLRRELRHLGRVEKRVSCFAGSGNKESLTFCGWLHEYHSGITQLAQCITYANALLVDKRLEEKERASTKVFIVKATLFLCQLLLLFLLGLIETGAIFDSEKIANAFILLSSLPEPTTHLFSWLDSPPEDAKQFMKSIKKSCSIIWDITPSVDQDNTVLYQLDATSVILLKTTVGRITIGPFHQELFTNSTKNRGGEIITTIVSYGKKLLTEPYPWITNVHFKPLCHSVITTLTNTTIPLLQFKLNGILHEQSYGTPFFLNITFHSFTRRIFDCVYQIDIYEKQNVEQYMQKEHSRYLMYVIARILEPVLESFLNIWDIHIFIMRHSIQDPSCRDVFQQFGVYASWYLFHNELNFVWTWLPDEMKSGLSSLKRTSTGLMSSIARELNHASEGSLIVTTEIQDTMKSLADMLKQTLDFEKLHKYRRADWKNPISSCSRIFALYDILLEYLFMKPDSSLPNKLPPVPPLNPLLSRSNSLSSRKNAYFSHLSSVSTSSCSQLFSGSPKNA